MSAHTAMMPPDVTREAMDLLERSGALRRGHFILSSGLHSDAYCQCATLFEDPRIGGRMAELMARVLGSGLGADAVLAPAIGAVLWGYDLARALGVRSIFAERGADRTFTLRRGFALRPGDRVLLAEVVVTTGGSVLELVPLARGAGAEVLGVASVVDRSAGAFARKAQDEGFAHWALVTLELATYQPNDVPPELAAIPPEKPGSGGRGKQP